MKILRYRTTAALYPHYSLEAEVENDSGIGEKIIYVNMDVDPDGEKIKEVPEDGHWAYSKSLDEVDFSEENDSAYLMLDDHEIIEQMRRFWNDNPVFAGDGVWRDWPSVSS